MDDVRYSNTLHGFYVNTKGHLVLARLFRWLGSDAALRRERLGSLADVTDAKTVECNAADLDLIRTGGVAGVQPEWIKVHSFVTDDTLLLRAGCHAYLSQVVDAFTADGRFALKLRTRLEPLYATPESPRFSVEASEMMVVAEFLQWLERRPEGLYEWLGLPDGSPPRVMAELLCDIRLWKSVGGATFCIQYLRSRAAPDWLRNRVDAVPVFPGPVQSYAPSYDWPPS